VKTLRAIYCAALAAGFLLSGSAKAQGLPELAKAPEYNTGTLPNGITYYLVKNPNAPGFADFALVQPHRTDNAAPRQDLVDLPHFTGLKPYEFLASHSIRYDRNGYIRRMRDATCFRFSRVPVSQSEVSDSTLLMMFQLAGTWHYGQALVVSGDIDIAAIKERIRVLSMTVSQRESTDNTWQYSWRPQDKAEIVTVTSPIGYVHLSYRSPRADRELMNTIQPVMSRILASEMDVVTGHRLRAAFEAAGIPLIDYRFRYVGSDATAGDETISISFQTDPGKLSEALSTAAGVLSTLDEEGVSLSETLFARGIVSGAHLREPGSFIMTNSMYLDKCIANYLYGANLASYETLRTSFTGKQIDANRERELLNRYISAVLAPQRNLHIAAGAPAKPQRDSVAAAFAKGWEQGNSASPDIPEPSDTLKLYTPHRRVKLKNTATDAFTGGKMWTFSNGINVIFKKADTKGVFRYGFIVKGGLNEIPGLNGSEAAFASEVLPLCKVSGMSGEHFSDLLAMHGVSMNPELSLTDIRMSGAAPNTALSLVIKTMLSVACTSQADPDAYSRYRAEKVVRMVRDKYSEDGTRAILDSTMCPNYIYAAGSMPEIPGDDFAVRIAQYLQDKGGTMKNGLIVLIGDLDEAVTLRLLTRSLGDFKTGQQRAVRPRYDYPLRECWSTTFTTGGWRDRGVSVSLSAKQPFGADSYTRLQLACMVLESELSREMASKGVQFTVRAYADLLPAEKVSLYINCSPCAIVSGLPAGVKPVAPVDMLQSVRKVLNSLAVRDVDADELARCKTMLTDINRASETNLDQLLGATLDRASTGRDMRTGYKERIKAVKASELRALFAALSSTDCEFIVQ
jgi:hypothetical protein